MPIFRTAPSTDLRSAVARAVASSGQGNNPLLEMQADMGAAQTARNLSLADKARLEVEQMQRAEAERNNPAVATEYAGHVAGMDLPTATRLSNHLRGVLEQPSPADVDDAAAVGKDAQPFVTGAPNVGEGQRRGFQSALASLIANRLATGKTNAEQLARAGGDINKTALQNEAADATTVPEGNRLIAAMAGKIREPFKTNAQGTVLNEETGALNEGTQLADVVRKHVAQQAANQGAQAGLHNAQRLVATGEAQAGGKPPAGYAWGPRNAQGQPTLVPIEGGPAAPTAGAAGGLTGDEFLRSLPKPKADQIKALAEGRMQFPGGFALKSPYWQDMLSGVSQYDPNFDAVNYNARSKTRNAFVAGKEGQSLNALNTVMGHLDDLEKASTALNNTDYPFINKPLNALGAQASPDLKGRLNAFRLNVQAVASEMERAYRGTGGNVAEIEAWKQSMDDADSPIAIRKGLRQATKLLGSKIDALGDQYNKGMGTTKQGLELLTPRAQTTFNRLVGEGDRSVAAAPAALNAKGWALMKDAKGNQAYVSPDGKQFEEVR